MRLTLSLFGDNKKKQQQQHYYNDSRSASNSTCTLICIFVTICLIVIFDTIPGALATPHRYNDNNNINNNNNNNNNNKYSDTHMSEHDMSNVNDYFENNIISNNNGDDEYVSENDLDARYMLPNKVTNCIMKCGDCFSDELADENIHDETKVSSLDCANYCLQIDELKAMRGNVLYEQLISEKDPEILRCISNFIL